ncbi:1648_t:CDS:2 [Acaulospora morrowiae]|uniref:1648_t:CDS:1 n=1 Tax=Acaulospora morrowiae TaxID=94023 RepID=A0A9N8WQG7_9GLOM|nr:1648_t:CDS:2 [Acaulospora morrowiae]
MSSKEIQFTKENGELIPFYEEIRYIISKMNKLELVSDVEVLVHVICEQNQENKMPTHPYNYSLPVGKKLAEIREIFEKEGEKDANSLRMGSNCSFVHNNGGVILKEGEEKYKLSTILKFENNKNNLYIQRTLNPDWKRLIKLCENGFHFKEYYAEKIDQARKRAYKFSMKNKPINTCEEDYLECENKFEEMFKRNFISYGNAPISTPLLPWLLFSLGISYERSSELLTNYENSDLYSVTRVEKEEVELKDIKLTEDFVGEIEEALKEKDNDQKIKKLRAILDEYGHFYAECITLGGVIVTNQTGKKETYKTTSGKNIGGNIAENRINWRNKNSNSESNKKDASFRRILGGDQSKYNDNNKGPWIDSLKNSENWEIVRYEKVHPIFNLLDRELKKEVLKIFGLQIRKASVDEISVFWDPKKKTPYVYKLFKHLESVDDIEECKIFASLTCRSKNEIFSMRLHYESEKEPTIIIHKIDDNSKHSSKVKWYKIRIDWMVDGYPTVFDFGHQKILFEINNLEISDPENPCLRKKSHMQELSEDCILGTISSNTLPTPNKSSITGDNYNNPYKTTIVTGIHFSLNEHFAYVFAYDLEKKNKFEDKNFIKSLKFYSSTIHERGSEYKDYMGQINIDWNNGIIKRPNKLLKKEDIDICPLSKILNERTKEKGPSLALFVNHFREQSKECGILNIYSNNILYRPLSDSRSTKQTGKLSFFCIPV